MSELLLTGGRIFTGDPARPFAAALLIRDGRVLAAGDEAEAKAAFSGRGRVESFPGGMILPGLVDGHTHFLYFGLGLNRLNLTGLDSLAACRQAIRRAAMESGPDEWIVGFGWNHHAWAEGREPTRSDLDDVTANRPALLFRSCLHTAWVNSSALERAGISAQTPDPEGGRIDRDSAGLPTGLIRERIDLVLAALPEPRPDQLKAAALAAQDAALRSGLTGVHSMESLKEWDVWDGMDRDGRLKVRVHHTLPPEELETARTRGMKPGKGDRLWWAGIKLFADGSLGSGTAWLHEPYTDDPQALGLEFCPRADMVRHLRKAYDAGCDAAIHAIGDRAMSAVLDAVAEARTGMGKNFRDRIEHVQLFRPEHPARMRALGMIASVQPVHVTTDWSIADRRWGPDRCARAYAYRTLAQAGIPLVFGSDAPVEGIEPLRGLRAAVLRQDDQGRPAGGWEPQERLGLAAAIRAFTQGPAYASRRETDLGTLAPGKKADLVVLDRDLFSLPADVWPEVNVRMTVVDGEVVWEG